MSVDELIEQLEEHREKNVYFSDGYVYSPVSDVAIDSDGDVILE